VVSDTPFDRGVFTLSLDFELIWGTLDLFGPERFRKACTAERALVGKLLHQFVEFEVPATWLILGHLFLDGCAPVDAGKHPEIVRPSHRWVRGDWFEYDPAGTEETAPLFLARSLVEQIRACPVPQEIGSHSFSHVVFGDAGCSRETADTELAACVRAAGEMGIALRSFAFPRNSVGHRDLLRRHGFVCYRGPEPVWYESRGPGLVRRLGHLWDVLTVAAPPVVLPQRTEHGLWNLPGSMVYFPRHGPRRWVPMSFRVNRAVKGLNAAAARRQVFHLWFHPTNLVDQDGAMLDGLRQILVRAESLRDEGRLDFLPMAGVVRRVSALAGTGPTVGIGA
jgi:hypothetical protein